MGRFYKDAAMEQAMLIRDVPLLDETFDETLYPQEEYERELLAVSQPHHFIPSSRSST